MSDIVMLAASIAAPVIFGFVFAKLLPGAITKFVDKEIERRSDIKLEKVKGEIQGSYSTLKSSVDMLTASNSGLHPRRCCTNRAAGWRGPDPWGFMQRASMRKVNADLGCRPARSHCFLPHLRWIWSCELVCMTWPVTKTRSNFYAVSSIIMRLHHNSACGGLELKTTIPFLEIG